MSVDDELMAMLDEDEQAEQESQDEEPQGNVDEGDDEDESSEPEPQPEPSKPHDPDKGLQKLQQELGNLRREMEELRRPREEPRPEPDPAPTELDKLVNASDDEVDPYAASKALARELKAVREELAQERAGREWLSTGFQSTRAEMEQQRAEQLFRKTYPDFEGEYADVQAKAYEYLGNEYPGVDWSQVPAQLFSKHAKEAVDHVVGSMSPKPQADPALSDKPPKKAAGTNVKRGAPVKQKSNDLSLDDMANDPNFFFATEP